MSHIDQLEELDRQQRQQEQQTDSEDNNGAAFANAITEALDSSPDKVTTPLLNQEEIEDEDPPRINLTAVVCTAIVAVCATIILLAAHPWKKSEEAVQLVETEQAVQTEEKTHEGENGSQQLKEAEEQRKIAEEKVARKKAEQEKAAKEKAEQAKKKESNSIVVSTVKPGSNNVYYNCRLIDASSRRLTKNEVAGMSKNELALARNAIYARHGYQFKEANLREFFSKQSWFKPTNIDIANVEMSDIEVYNVNLIKAREVELQ